MLNGKDIESLHTVRQDNGVIAVWVGRVLLRLTVSTIAKMVDDYYFRLEKNHQHYWMVDAIKKTAA